MAGSLRRTEATFAGVSASVAVLQSKVGIDAEATSQQVASPSVI